MYVCVCVCVCVCVYYIYIYIYIYIGIMYVSVPLLEELRSDIDLHQVSLSLFS